MSGSRSPIGWAAIGVLAAGAWLGATAPARALSGMESAQEVTLASLGVPGEAATGSPLTLSVAFPPPLGPPSGTGGFVRVFYSHSPRLDPVTSSLTVAVNGEPLTAVQLGDATGAGAVFEVRIAASTPAGRPEGLPGDAAGVDADGRVWQLGDPGLPPVDRASPAAVQALGVMATAAIAALLVWQLVLPREVAR